MIARYWRGRVRSRDVEEYVEYVRRTGVAAHRSTPGNVGSMVLVHDEETEAEVVVVSLWVSLDAIRQFAGDEAERAVFYPEDERYLVAADPFARHYEVPAYALVPDPAGVTDGERRIS